MIEFRRIEGCGNVLTVVIDDRLSDDTWRALSRNLLHPSFGVGSDGLMLVRPQQPSGTFPVKMFNPDGSESGMCGNGVRCVVRALVLAGLLPELEAGGSSEWLPLRMGERDIFFQYQGNARQVSVQMGDLNWDAKSLGMQEAQNEEFINEPLVVAGVPTELRWSVVGVGNPHCVTMVDALPSAEQLADFGSRVERSHHFKNRTNVEFVKVLGRSVIKVLVWERGAGATLACGSGACAAMAVSQRLGLVDSVVSVEMPGGKMSISLDSAGRSVTLTGPANEISRGWFEDDFLKRCGLDTEQG